MGKARDNKVFHKPRGTDGRQRDIFPLPTIQISGVVNKGVSRSVARRIQSRDHVTRGVNKAILALNSLYFGRGGPPSQVKVDNVEGLPLLQKDAIQMIRKHVKRLGPPGHASCSGALAALRVASSAYAEAEPSVGEVVGMDLKALSLPSGNVAGVDLDRSLGGSLHDVVFNFEEHMLQDAGVWMDLQDIAQEIRTYDDPLLKDRHGYLEFLSHLYHCGVLGFTSCCRGRVGAFAVSKKSKIVNGEVIQRQRLVLDCRASNLQFKAPPVTRLGSLAALSELEIPSEHRLHLAGADIRDCFYGCRCPPGLQDFFCLRDDISFSELDWVTGGMGSELCPGSRICPCISVLPMGFTWSFYIIQMLHEQISLHSLGLNEDMLIRDAHPPPILQSHDVAAMPYCDNVHALSFDASACQAGADSVCDGLRSAGFELHEEVSATTLFPTLGGEVDGELGTISASRTRMWNLIMAFEYAAESVVSPDLIQRLLGHAMVVCVLHRSGMSIFRYLYDFVQHGGAPRKLNPSEANECRVFAGLVPLLVSNMKMPWSPIITCTDASPTGYGVCEYEAGVDVARQLGRWQERWRFRRLSPAEWQPRKRAAGLDPFRDMGTVRGTLDEVDDLDQYTANESFPEIPAGIMNPSLWRTVSMGKWEHTREHITLKEGRALVLAVRRLTRAKHQRGLKHVVILDNLALCFSVGKGRCHNFALLRVLQQLAALSLASGIQLRPRWTPSELNVSDGPSRGQVCPGPFKKDWDIAPTESQECEDSQGQTQASSCKDEPYSDCSEASGECSAQERRQEDVAKPPCFSSSAQEQKGGWTHPQGASRGPWQVGTDKSTHCPGEPEHQRRDPKPIQSLLHEVRGLLSGERHSSSNKIGRRRSIISRFSGHLIPGWQVSKRGRKDCGISGVSQHPPEGKPSSVQTGPSRLEKEYATVKSPPIASIGNVRDCHEPGSKGPCRSRIDDTGGLQHVPASGRGVGSSEEEYCSSGQKGRSPVQVHHSYHSGQGRRKARQGRCFRQQLADRCQAVPVSGRSSVESCFEVQPSQGPDFQLHHGRVPQVLPAGRSRPGAEQCSSLSASPWRSYQRSGNRGKGFPGSEKQRKMENGSECPSICKDRSHSAVTHSDVPSGSQVLQVGRSQLVQSDDKPVGTTKLEMSGSLVDIFSASTRPRKFALEIFAGTGRVSQALCDAGIPTYPIDNCLFPSHNVLDPHVHNYIRNFITSGRVLLIWLGMPCTTFSRARRNDGRGPGPLRDSQHLWGLPNLRCHDQHKLQDGNALFHFTMDILHLAGKYNIPTVIENPLTSLAWSMPPMVRYFQLPGVQCCDLDFCQFNERWLKPTRLVSRFLDISQLSRRCTGTYQLCSHSRRPHIPLVGKDASGTWWTRRAQPYPFAMVRLFALLALHQLRKAWCAGPREANALRGLG